MGEATHDHPVRGRFHAWFLSATEDLVERIHGDRKRALLSDLHGTIVELGPGTGANCRHFSPSCSVIGVEPNVRMHELLRDSARRHGVDLEIRGLKGEKLDIESGSADAVVCTLVLCSVDEPATVLAEAHRVLKPGGRFAFNTSFYAGTYCEGTEHVYLRWVQEATLYLSNLSAERKAAGLPGISRRRGRAGRRSGPSTM